MKNILTFAQMCPIFLHYVFGKNTDATPHGLWAVFYMNVWGCWGNSVFLQKILKIH